MRRAATVLVVEQRDEVRMRGEVVEGALDQLLDRLLGRQSLEVELALLGADLLVDPFQHRQIQRVLVAEIVVDQLFVDAGARRDLVDPGAGQPAGGKFTPRRRQQLLPRCGRVARKIDVFETCYTL